MKIPLQEKIAELEARIASLESKIAKLQSQSRPVQNDQNWFAKLADVFFNGRAA